MLQCIRKACFTRYCCDAPGHGRYIARGGDGPALKLGRVNWVPPNEWIELDTCVELRPGGLRAVSNAQFRTAAQDAQRHGPPGSGAWADAGRARWAVGLAFPGAAWCARGSQDRL